MKLVLIMAGVVVAAQTVTVPFVGCEIDGQSGPVATPQGPPVRISAKREVAAKLAYYEGTMGILGPRGWHCLNGYGSNGGSMFITPTKLRPSEFSAYDGPFVSASFSHGSTSGRFEVAATTARLFPSRMDVVLGVEKQIETKFPRGPFQKDVLVRRSETVVEFETPGGQEGFGVGGSIKKNSTSVQGVALLTGEPPHLLQLSIRVPSADVEMRSAMIRHLREVVAPQIR